MPATVLLDTSIWVLYLRPRRYPELKTAVRERLQHRDLATCWAVKAEVLIGARDLEAFGELRDTLDTVEDIPIVDQVWQRAARLGQRLRKEKGIKLAVPDLLIAQCAIDQGLLLWHADRHFEVLREVSALQTELWEPTSASVS